MKKRIFSGMQPSGKLHIGNYLGAAKNWIQFQDDYDAIFFIVDWHAITVPYDEKQLPQNVLEVAADYIASGVDPNKATLFVQSDVKEHVELSWIFETIAPIGDLERMTQFKDKKQQHEKNISAGLLTYPALMAADILLYDAELVPVGEDQKQHVEFTRRIAERFNNRFGETFKLPDVYNPPQGARIKSLIEPERKMSKSRGEKHCILLADEPDVIMKKVKSATTDSGNEIIARDDKPGITNLLTIYSSLTGTAIPKLEEKCEGMQYGAFKKETAEVIIDALRPIREKRNELLKDPATLTNILQHGAEKARTIAAAKMNNVRKKMGLR
jgi:tryptophanyl-tRNA synthetase